MKNSMRNIAGKRIRIAREKATPKITQLELSARLQTLGINIGDSTIGKMENGASAITDVQLIAFAKALRVSTSWLLGEKE